MQFLKNQCKTKTPFCVSVYQDWSFLGKIVTYDRFLFVDLL